MKLQKILLKMALAGMICGSAFLPGCGTRVIVVPMGEPIRVRETVKKAKVWVADKDGKEVEGEADIPAGWYALPDTRK